MNSYRLYSIPSERAKNWNETFWRSMAFSVWSVNATICLLLLLLVLLFVSFFCDFSFCLVTAVGTVPKHDEISDVMTFFLCPTLIWLGNIVLFEKWKVRNFKYFSASKINTKYSNNKNDTCKKEEGNCDAMKMRVENSINNDTPPWTVDIVNVGLQQLNGVIGWK